MTTPANIVTEATTTVGKAFNWKNLLFLVVLTVVVTLIVSYIMKQEVVLYDNTGNTIGKGEIKPTVKFSIKKNV